MTDLAQAIAEVKRTTDAAHPFVVSHFSDCSILSGQEQEVATILNAAASGELIPRADADLAVALMMKKAATQADPWDGPVTKNKIVDAQAIAAQQIKARIRALAPADGLAAVDALRAEARENAMQALASMGQAQEAYEAQLEAEAELSTLRAQVERLTGALGRAQRALKPFADRVFNDNGDCTISDTHTLTPPDYWNAQSAERIACTILKETTND